jgi:hypothetical protein
MLGLVDGDIVVFRAGFGAERNRWHLKVGDGEVSVHEYKRDAVAELDKLLPGKYSRVEGEDYMLFPEKELEPLSHALQNVKKMFDKFGEELKINPALDMKVALSKGGETFRHKLAKTRPYKGNRKVEHRPTYEKEIRDYIIRNWPTFIAEDEEADDLLGIWQTADPEGTVIITIDKDLDQVPGLKYNIMHETTHEINQQRGDYNLCMQILTGDSTDNIPGLPGVGPGKAAKFLHGLEDSYDSMMEEIIRQYQIRSGKEDWQEYLLEQARLVYIRRQPDEMWEIPNVWSEDDAQQEYTL